MVAPDRWSRADRVRRTSISPFVVFTTNRLLSVWGTATTPSGAGSARMLPGVGTSCLIRPSKALFSGQKPSFTTVPLPSFLCVTAGRPLRIAWSLLTNAIDSAAESTSRNSQKPSSPIMEYSLSILSFHSTRVLIDDPDDHESPESLQPVEPIHRTVRTTHRVNSHKFDANPSPRKMPSLSM